MDLLSSFWFICKDLIFFAFLGLNQIITVPSIFPPTSLLCFLPLQQESTCSLFFIIILFSATTHRYSTVFSILIVCFYFCINFISILLLMNHLCFYPAFSVNPMTRVFKISLFILLIYQELTHLLRFDNCMSQSLGTAQLNSTLVLIQVPDCTGWSIL